jgi:hypothetical protein
MATGELNPKMYGTSFYPKLSQEVLATQSRPGDGWGESPAEERARRSIYMFVKRSLLPPLHTAFDFPDVDTSCEARFITVQPGQAMALLNGEFANSAAVQLAKRVIDDAGEEPQQQVASAIRIALLRPASDDEIAEGMALVEALQKRHGLAPREALEQWCLVVLNLSEFLFLD